MNDSVASMQSTDQDPSGVRFRGLVIVAVSDAREFEAAACDVMVEPTDEDPAHANFVVDRDIRADLETQNALVKLFRAVEPAKIEELRQSARET